MENTDGGVLPMAGFNYSKGFFWPRKAKLLIFFLFFLFFSSPSCSQESSSFERVSSGEEEILLPSRLAVTAGDSIFPEENPTSLSSVGLWVTNFGVFGNNLRTRAPSMEYPLGSKIDHLIRAGLWVGGFNTDRGETLVTTGTIDGYYNRPANEATEFTPLPYMRLLERSTLPNSKYYDPARAISEQDFVARYGDTPGFTKRSGEPHRPLGVEVTQESYAWSFEPSDAFILVRFFIKNICGPGCYLRDVYVGLYSQLASGWKGGYENWPPSGWFRKTDIEYLHENKLFMEHHFLSERGNPATSWAGTELLTWRSSPPSDTLQQVSFNWWEWQPFLAEEMLDVKRYKLMLNGEVDGTAGVEAEMQGPYQSPYSPCGLISLGPFKEIGPDSTIVVSFAFVGGSGRSDLIDHAKWALEVARSGFVTYTPPPSPLMKVVPGKGKVTLRWDDSPEKYIDPKSQRADFEGYKIYIGEQGTDLTLIGEFDTDTDTIGYNTGMAGIEGDSTVIGGVPYKYSFSIENLKDGFKYWASVTSFDTGEVDSAGNVIVGSKESGIAFNKTMFVPGPREKLSRTTVFPNPYRGKAAWDGSLSRDRYIWFANLPKKAEIRIYTISGDLIDTIHFDSESYQAQNVRGVINPGGELPGTGEKVTLELSGTMCAWDLITRHDQAVASGLYIFSVKDLETGEVELGKFLVIK